MKEKDVSLFSIVSFSFQPMKGEWVIKERKGHK